MRARFVASVALGFLVAGSPLSATLARAAEVGDCAGQINAVVIQVDAHRLSLCRDGHSEQSFAVSLGSGGIDKQKEGDHRTPIGVFALGAPRPSKEFLIFIPVGYPNAEQRRAGYTGGDIGIHGPKKPWRWLGRLANWKDWTRGCIALNSEDGIREVAAWVEKNRTARVEIVRAPR